MKTECTSSKFKFQLLNHRNADFIEHTVFELVAQRIYELALIYEDLNDMALLAGKSTLNRLELTPEDADSSRDGEPNQGTSS